MSAVTQSPLFGIALTVAAYSIGLWVNRRTGLSIANPNLIAIPLIILCLLLTGTPLADYQRGGEVINMLLGPATAALALSIYRQREVLRESFLPVLLASGLAAGLLDDALQLVSDRRLNSRFPSAQRATLVSVSSLIFSLFMIPLSPLFGRLFS